MQRVILGILTTYPDGSSCRLPRSPQWRPFAELSRIGKGNGVLVYVFSPAGVDWRGRRVLGFRWTSGTGSRSGRWHRGLFPLPDVVYNRVPTRIAEGQPAVQRTLRAFHRVLNGRVFNPHYLNKSRVARALSADEEAAQYAPATMLFREGPALRQFLQRHPMVYIKSVGGSLGNDIMRLARAPGGGWFLHFNNGPLRTRRVRHWDWNALMHDVRRLMRGRPFIVQQGIRLAQVNGRPFDLRGLVQKQPDGRWQFTGGAARIAGRGQITTHVPRGGHRLSMEKALEAAYGPESASKVHDNIVAAAIRAAEVVDAHLRERFVEMSLDIGVDRQGRPWIFEMNAKPLHFDERDIQRRRNRHLLEYTRAAASSGRG